MKTILVPTDFSAVAKTAATYAMKLAGRLHATTLIFYNAYQAPVMTEPGLPVVQLLDIDSLKQISEEGLQNFTRELKTLCPPQLKIETISEFAILTNSINDICERTGADLIIMGITGGSKLEEVLIGSTATSVVSHSKVPVIVIPPGAVYNDLNKIMLACDFGKVEDSTPLHELKHLLDITGARLYVLHTYKNDKDITADKNYRAELLKGKLHTYNPEYHFEKNDNFIDGINEFADNNKIDLIVTIPKKHGFFDNIFKENHTKQLAFHSHVPLMCIHEDEHKA